MSLIEDCEYAFLSRMGKVLIKPNDEDPLWWDLYIGGRLICPAQFFSPEEAALRASQREFGSKELNSEYIGLRVPSDLGQWRKQKPSHVKR